MNDQADWLYERLLVLRCQTGDEDAFKELVARFGPRLLYFLHKLLKRADQAEDLAQEVWIDVLRQLPNLKDASAFRTWLYRIARGKTMLGARRKGRLPTTSCDIELIAEQKEATFSPDDAALIHSALDQLEPLQREVLMLRFLEELSYEEIGEIVGCPVGTVRSRIFYAKAALQRLLKHCDN